MLWVLRRDLDLNLGMDVGMDPKLDPKLDLGMALDMATNRRLEQWALDSRRTRRM